LENAEDSLLKGKKEKDRRGSGRGNDCGKGVLGAKGAGIKHPSKKGLVRTRGTKPLKKSLVLEKSPELKIWKGCEDLESHCRFKGKKPSLLGGGLLHPSDQGRGCAGGEKGCKKVGRRTMSISENPRSEPRPFEEGIKIGEVKVGKRRDYRHRG